MSNTYGTFQSILSKILLFTLTVCINFRLRQSLLELLQFAADNLEMSLLLSQLLTHIIITKLKLIAKEKRHVVFPRGPLIKC